MFSSVKDYLINIITCTYVLTKIVDSLCLNMMHSASYEQFAFVCVT